MSKKKSIGWHIRKGIVGRISHYGSWLIIPCMAVLLGVLLYTTLDDNELNNIKKVEGVCSDVYRQTDSRTTQTYLVIKGNKYRLVSYDFLLKIPDGYDSMIGKEVILEYVYEEKDLFFDEYFEICSLQLADGSEVYLSLVDMMEYAERNRTGLFWLSIICFVSAGVGAIVLCYKFPYDGESFKQMIKRHKRQKQKKQKTR